MSRRVMTGDELTKALAEAPGWKIEDNALTQTRVFDDFAGAMQFVNGAATLAQELGHHPDIDIRYNKVKLGLTTHDSGGITEMDLRLAARLDRI